MSDYVVRMVVTVEVNGDDTPYRHAVSARSPEEMSVALDLCKAWARRKIEESTPRFSVHRSFEALEGGWGVNDRMRPELRFIKVFKNKIEADAYAEGSNDAVRRRV